MLSVSRQLQLVATGDHNLDKWDHHLKKTKPKNPTNQNNNKKENHHLFSFTVCMTKEKGFASLLLPNSRIFSQHPDSVLSYFKFFHIKLNGHHVAFLPISAVVSASRPGLEMSPAFKEKSARHPGSVSQEHTTHTAGTSCSSKAANSLCLKPVKALLFPGAGPVHPRDSRTGRVHPSKPPWCFSACSRPCGLPSSKQLWFQGSCSAQPSCAQLSLAEDTDTTSPLKSQECLWAETVWINQMLQHPELCCRGAILFLNCTL